MLEVSFFFKFLYYDINSIKPPSPHVITSPQLNRNSSPPQAHTHERIGVFFSEATKQRKETAVLFSCASTVVLCTRNTRIRFLTLVNVICFFYYQNRLILFIVPITAMLPDICVLFIKRFYFPTEQHIIREKQCAKMEPTKIQNVKKKKKQFCIVNLRTYKTSLNSQLSTTKQERGENKGEGRK